MSNDVTIPENIGAPAPVFRERNIRIEAPLDGFGFNLVTARGNRFYLRYEGDEKVLANPATGRPSDYFDFVVLQQAKRKSHTYYKDGYKPGSHDGPTCQSTDGIAPDDSVPDYDPATKTGKQSSSCDLCQHAEWKMQPTGRKGRACADNLRLAVFPMPLLINATIGRDILEPLMFRLPPASLKLFYKLQKRMVERFGEDAPPCSYITRATLMDTQWPQFEYNVVRFLKPEETEVVLELRETPTAWRILGLTPEGRSLVRRLDVATESVATSLQRQVGALGASAFERAIRDDVMDQIPRPETLELQAQKVEPQVPLDDEPLRYIDTDGAVKPKPAANQVPDTAADIDALVAAMRPRKGA